MHIASFRSDLVPILKSHEYKLITIGSASLIGLISAFATYAPSFMQGLGFFETEGDASFTFGALTCATGLIGTLCGGISNDILKRRLKGRFQCCRVDDNTNGRIGGHFGSMFRHWRLLQHKINS